MLPGGDPEAAVSALEGLAGSTRVISSIDEVHASEWDAIVLSSHLGRRFFGGSGDGFTRRDAPVHLNAIVLLTGDGSFQDVLEDGSKTYIRALGPHFAKGRRATISDGLADELEFLVRHSWFRQSLRVTSSTGSRRRAPDQVSAATRTPFSPS